MALEAKVTQEYQLKFTTVGESLINKSLKAIADRNWHLETQYKRLEAAKKKGSETEIRAATKSIETDKKKLRQLEQELAMRQRIYGLQRQQNKQLTEDERNLRAKQRQMERDALQRDKLTGRESQRIWKGMGPEDKIDYQITRFKQVFRRVADALISFYVINALRTVFGGFFRNMVQANSQLELMRQRLTTLGRGGGSFENIKKAIVELTVTTPFMVQDFADAAVQLEAFGLNAEKYLKPVADWASVTGKGVQDAATAFAKIATGSPRTALLLSTRAISKEEFDKELASSASRAEALRKILDRNFGDMAQRMSKTFQGFLSNINDIFFFISEKLGRGLFLALRTDIERVYNNLKNLSGGFDDVNPAMLKFSQTLNGLYTILKSAAPFLLVIAGIWTSKRMSETFSGLLKWVQKTSAAAQVFTKIAGVVTLLASAIFLLEEQIKTFQRYDKAAADATEAAKKFWMGSSEFIDAYQEKLLQLQTIQNNFGTMFIEGLAILQTTITGGLWKGGAVAYMAKLRKELEETGKAVADALRLRQKETQLRLARDPASAQELFQLRTLMEEKSLGREYLQAYLKRVDARKSEIKAELQAKDLTDDKRDALEVEYQRAMTLADTISLVLRYNKEQLRTRANLESVNNVVKATIPSTAELIDNFDGLLDKEKATSEAAKDLLERLSAVKEEIRSLHSGEATKWSQIVKFNALIAAYRHRLRTDGSLSQEDRLRFELKLHEAIRDRMRARKEFESDIADKANEALKARKGLLEAESDYAIRVLEMEYEKTRDLASLEQARGKTLAQIKNQIREAEAARLSAEQRAARYPMDPMAQVEASVEIYRWEQEIVDLRKKELELIKDIVFATSTEWVNAFWKVKLELLETINLFKDRFAKFLTDSVISTTTGIISDLLWGTDNDDKAAQKIADLNQQLLELRSERDREFAQVEKSRRAANETNEEYANRMRMWEQQTELQKMSWEYQDKELQILSDINAQEEQRNEIILNRLKSLGQKVMDELIGQVITIGVSRLFSGVQPTVSDTIKGYGGDLYNTGPHDRPNTTNIYIEGNTFMNEQDFTMQVDRAVAKISDRRGANARYTR